jgi:hypothetical protein
VVEAGTDFHPAAADLLDNRAVILHRTSPTVGVDAGLLSAGRATPCHD